MNPISTLICLIAALCALSGCSKNNAAAEDPRLKGLEDISLKCQGSLMENLGAIKQNQVIAAHIKDGAITFSGHTYLRGENLQICPKENTNLPSDILYFDSKGCDKKSLGYWETSGPRQSGTYNKILKHLNLTNKSELTPGNVWRLDSNFECERVE